MARVKEKISRSLFIIPALALLATFVVYPVASTIYLSFATGDPPFPANYWAVLSSREIIDARGFVRGFPLGALLHNFLWMLIHLPLTTFLGLVLAIIVRNVRGSGVIKSSIFLGMVIPMIVGGVIIRFMFDKDAGVVNAVLGLLGLTTRSWTAHPESALLALIFGSVWLWTGFSMILYSAGLSTIPRDYYEAAMVDGATPVRMFFSITLPLLKPITTVIVTMTILWELKIFDIVYVATLGGPGGASNVLALQMYFYAFRQFDLNRASVVATILMFLTLAAAIPMITSVIRRERR
ncbi:sugar ABC transporter permease [Candidatus Bipolaricaulota bacterium]|nr:sugar ABC transporter permease [Candidatus Bipolaricaulota bacterium]